ncbi:hypothetical protein GZH53_13440 [Flavihumibacter sp. R14]|nr:hypothetical protein [Flavihumibacter soli]
MKTTDIKKSIDKLRFDISGYYFIGLLVFVILGFWPSYFAKFFNGTADFSFYFHFHAAMMILWVCMLIIQPILIRKKKFGLHRFNGRLSYFLFPMMLVSIILIVHQRHAPIDEPDLDITLFNQFRPFIMFLIAYVIAIRYRHNINIHARAMIATGILILEPALTRLVLNLFGVIKSFATSPYFFYFATIFSSSIIFLLITGLIIRERKQNRGRWVFPFILSLYFITYLIGIFRIHIGLQSFAKWFTSLPLT